MPKFFIDPPISDIISITGENAAHISGALRMRVGDDVVLCDGAGKDYFCRLTDVDKNCVTAQLLYTRMSESEPSTSLTLYQCLPKGDKLELVTQKAVELGCSKIVPVLSERCVSRPDAKSAMKKTARMQKIALEAAKQSGRGIIPEVTELTKFSAAIKDFSAHSLPVFFYEGGGSPLSGVLNGEKDVAIFIGPEGGFSPDEVETAKNLGAKVATLGPRILRTETAPIAAIAAIMFSNGDMD